MLINVLSLAVAKSEDVKVTGGLPRLSEQLELDALWQTLSDCLTALGQTTDQHAVLVLQPAVEAFFLVHAGYDEKQLFCLNYQLV